MEQGSAVQMETGERPAPPDGPRQGGALPASFDLTGRVAVVTGARRGIGRAIAQALAGQGAAVVVHHAGGDEEAGDAEAVAAAIAAGGGTAWAACADFSGRGSGAGLGAWALAAAGRADIVVLNASMETHEEVEDIGLESFELQMRVNLAEPLFLLQALVPGMVRRRWGRILTVGSTQQCRPSARKMVYGATKAAQMNWVLSLARQFGPHGVTVNNVAPGVIATARNAGQVEEEGARLVQGIPARRLGTPQDVAGAALLLCSDAGAYINGSNLWVDGGRHIG